MKQSTVFDPLEFDSLETVRIRRPVPKSFKPAGDGAVAYLVEWKDDHACRLLSGLLSKKFNVRVATGSFSAMVDSRDTVKEFDAGTLMIPLAVQSQSAARKTKLSDC